MKKSRRGNLFQERSKEFETEEKQIFVGSRVLVWKGLHENLMNEPF
jgi:hypothetical protein